MMEATSWAKARRAERASCKHRTPHRARFAGSVCRFRQAGANASVAAEQASKASSGRSSCNVSTTASAWPTGASEGRQRGGAALDRGSFFLRRQPIPTEEPRLRTLFLYQKSRTTEGSVSSQARSKLKWRSDEITFLRYRYATTPGAELARALGRSLASIHMKAMKLGLKRKDGHASTPAMREAGKLRRGRPCSEAHRAALRVARLRWLNNEVQPK